MKNLENHFKMLVTTPSISGHENEIALKIKKLIEKKVDEIKINKVGSVIAKITGTGNDKKFPKKKIVYDAHIDQIGFMVCQIEKNGFLRITNIGGINAKAILGKLVTIYGKKNIKGIIGQKPPHVATEHISSMIQAMTEIFIDTGLSAKEVNKIVSVGDVALIESEPTNLLCQNFTSCGLDDKACVAALLQTIDILQITKPYHDVYFVFSVQEEVHKYRGATTAVYEINPEIAIAIDVTFADHESNPGKLILGKGPVITMGPGFDRKLAEKFSDIASREDIPSQIEIDNNSAGTNASGMQIERKGNHSLLISIPLRYMHSNTEVINLKDTYRTAKLLALFTLENELGIEEII